MTTSPPATSPFRLKSLFRHSGKFVFGLVLTALVLWGVLRFMGGREALARTLANANWVWLVPALFFVGVNLCLSAERWRTIVKAMDYSLPFAPAFNAVMITWPLALFTPSRASDLLRAWIVRDRVPFWEGGGSVLSEKLIDIQSLCLLAMIGSSFQGLWFWFFLALGILVAEWVTVFVLLRSSHWLQSWTRWTIFAEKLYQALTALHGLVKHPRLFFRVCFLSLSAWIGSFIMIGSLLQLVHCPLPVTAIMALWPLAMFVGQLPLTLAGMGTRDLAFYSLLVTSALFSVDKSGVLTATFLYALITSWLPAILGIPFVIRYLSFSPSESSEQN